MFYVKGEVYLNGIKYRTKRNYKGRQKLGCNDQ